MERARPNQTTASSAGADSAAGTLDATPLAHILVHARQRALSGVLRLERDGDVASGAIAESIEIELARGFVRAARSSAELTLPLARVVVRAFGFPGAARFVFRPGSESARGDTGADLEPLALLWAGLRAYGSEASAQRVLGRLGAGPLALAGDVALDRYGFSAEERRIADRFRAPSRPGATRIEVLVAYVLAITKALAPAPTTSAPRAEPKRFTTPPMGSTRVPKYTSDAKQNFQNAEIALAQHDLELAETLCRRAHEEEPRHAEYLALLAWLRTFHDDGHTPAAVKEALEMLERAIDLHPGCERAYMYRAQIRKAAGDHEGAIVDFRAVRTLNPNNVEASREIRIHEMRAKRAAEEERRSSGLFQRILRKK